MAAEDIPLVVGMISTLLERATERNDEAAWLGAAPVASAFRSTTKPDISVRAYIARIARHAECSPACFVAAYIYLDRHHALAVDSYSVHRLLLAAVKFLDDTRHNNAYFARVGGISLPEMNRLELDFLFGVGFDINVPPDTFGHYCAMLQFEMLCLEPPEAPLPPPAAARPEDDGSCSGRQQQRDG